MFLAIDAGNSNLFLGVFDGERLIATERLPTVRENPKDYAESFQPFLAQHPPITSFCAAGSAADVVALLKQTAREWLGIQPISLDENKAALVPHRIEHFETVGIDRLLNVVAATPTHGAPLIIVDMGTATTVDAVDADGTFLGGAILPGFHTAAEALYRMAPRLPRVAYEFPDAAIGRDTTRALQSGLMLGQAGQISALVGRMRKEMNAEAKVIGTGGVSGLFAGVPGLFDRHDPNLILHGIRLAAERAG